MLAIDILDGIYDQHLNDEAVAIAALKGTVMLEWEPEMLSNKRDQQFYTGVPPDQWGPTYVAVWKHIHDIFLANGATNVQWVWSPTGTEYKTEQNGQIACAPYFPGLGYVDWMGLHSYNKLNKPQSFVSENETTFYYQAPIFGPGLPLIISQTAAGNTTRAQRVWIATAHSSIPKEIPSHSWLCVVQPGRAATTRQLAPIHARRTRPHRISARWRTTLLSVTGCNRREVRDCDANDMGICDPPDCRSSAPSGRSGKLPTDLLPI